MDKNNSQPVDRPTSAFRLAGRFLFTPNDDTADRIEPGWSAASHWLLPWGLLAGVAYAAVFGLSWRWFGEYQGVRWLPALAVLVLDLGFFGRRPLIQAALLGMPDKALPATLDTQARTLATVSLILILVVLAKFALLNCLPIGAWQSPPTTGTAWPVLPAYLRFLAPPLIYRPLILMPLWGRWAMSLALTIGRVAPTSSTRLHGMTNRSSIRTVLLQWLFCAALTTAWCSGFGYHPARGIVLGLLLLVAAYLSSFFLSHRAHGQTESTVAATGLVGELTFLIFYVGASNTIYWY